MTRYFVNKRFALTRLRRDQQLAEPPFRVLPTERGLEARP